MKRQDAIKFRQMIETAAESQDDATALESVELFPKWNGYGMKIEAGKRYFEEGYGLYKANISHTSQSDWPPHLVSNLFTKVSLDEWPEIPVNIDAEHAWMKGQKGTWKDEHYICDMDYCVWNPDVLPSAWIKQP